MITQDLPVLTYTVRELAASAKVSETKIWMEIADGELETILVGDRRLITPQQAERWLERKAARAKTVREQRAKKRDQHLVADTIPPRRNQPSLPTRQAVLTR
jgi:excisionase family DNA binding protein